MSNTIFPTGPRPRGALFEDTFSWRKEDAKVNFYILKDSWEFLGRFYSILEALEHVPRIETPDVEE